MPNNITSWKKIHNSSTLPSTFQAELSSAWQLCKRSKIPYDMETIPCLSDSQFDNLKKTSLRLYAYANRCISLLLTVTEHNNICFALFNESGILLKLYGEQFAINALAPIGVKRLSNWGMNTLGANAVSIGLANNITTDTCGIENYARPLINKAIYFSPCSIENDNSEVSYVRGGIALIVPEEEANPNYSMLCASIAYDINLHIFMSNSLENAYSNDERGVLTIDENIYTGKKYILYHDQNLCNILGLTYSNIYFQPLENLIAPIPENEQFWNIINTRMAVNDYLLALTIQGRTENFMITTEPHSQSKLAIKGIRVFFTSLRFLSAKISKNIGHNAVFTFGHLLGKTNNFLIALRQAKIFAKSDKNVLIFGESGTGKDVFAQAIHNASGRSTGPFITFNCDALPREQTARELFGYESPEQHEIQHIGLFELAHNGTIYLNEINLLPLDLQALLFNVIENKIFTRVGGFSQVYSDVRIIASTNTDLIHSIEKHKFRTDLYYRLNTLHLFLPPLRDRHQDIPLLADFFIKSLCSKMNLETKQLSPEAKKTLQKIPWHGNIRELQSIIETVTLLTPATIIEPEHIFEYISNPNTFDDISAYSSSNKGKITKDELIRTLQSCHYNKKLTAQKLGISRRTLYRYMEKFNIEK